MFIFCIIRSDFGLFVSLQYFEDFCGYGAARDNQSDVGIFRPFAKWPLELGGSGQ